VYEPRRNACPFSPVLHRHFKRDEFEVLVLTQSRRRLEALRHVAGRVVSGDHRGADYLSTFDALAPSAFASATWWDLGGETYAGVLFDA
jgi:hypothetical protein